MEYLKIFEDETGDRPARKLAWFPYLGTEEMAYLNELQKLRDHENYAVIPGESEGVEIWTVEA